MKRTVLHDLPECPRRDGSGCTPYLRGMIRYGGAGLTLVVLVAGTFLGGCAGMGGSGKTKTLVAGARIPFAPQTRHVSINLAKGAYPELYSNASYADWSSSQEGEGAGMAEIVCCLESVFSDSSIAYDVVGLRGMQVYLYTDDGRRIAPARTLIGQMLEEEPRGALKAFRRTNRLLFPLEGLTVAAAPPDAPPASLRLVFEGYDSVFYFEWAGQNLLPVRPVPFYKSKAAHEVKKEVRKVRQRSSEFGHTFD